MAAAASYSMDQQGRAQVMKVKGTSSYPTGGYDLNQSFVNNIANRAKPLVGLNDGGTQIALIAGAKVKFIVAATGAEVANATDMSAVTVSVLVP